MVETDPQPPLYRGGISERWGAICRPLSVLLAEDNRINQQFATLVLNKAGHSVEIAANGRHAIDALCRSDFDAVLMDVQMPELDGIQATRQIRTLPEPKRSVPIIAVSAHAMAGAREECLAAGVDDYISKPFQPIVLLSMLTKFSDRSSGPIPITASETLSEHSGATPIEELPILDLEQLSVFGSVFSQSKVRSLVALYVIDVDARLILIAQHRAVKDFDGVSRQAHMIVNTAGNLGAKQTSALARTLEVSCMNRDYTLCDRQITALRYSCYRSSIALRQRQIAESPHTFGHSRIGKPGFP